MPIPKMTPQAGAEYKKIYAVFKKQNPMATKEQLQGATLNYLGKQQGFRLVNGVVMTAPQVQQYIQKQQMKQAAQRAPPMQRSQAPSNPNRGYAPTKIPSTGSFGSDSGITFMGQKLGRNFRL
jgi:hypothetical protein